MSTVAATRPTSEPAAVHHSNDLIHGLTLYGVAGAMTLSKILPGIMGAFQAMAAIGAFLGGTAAMLNYIKGCRKERQAAREKPNAK